MIKSVRFLLLLIAFVSMQIVAWGQPQERLVQVQVTPDHTNWLYKPGEKVKFKVAVLKCNIPQDNLEVRYEISEDMMKPHQTGKQPLKNEKLEINAGTMKKKGFCVAALSSLAKGVSMKAWLPSASLLRNCNRPLRCPPTFWNFGKAPKKPQKSGHWNR